MTRDVHGINLLADLLPGKVRTEVNEMLCYAHDTGVSPLEYRLLPRKVRRSVVTVPDAVVKITSRTEIIKVMEVAKQHSLALVPRGAGTSYSAGAYPTVRKDTQHSGLVVLDMTGLDGVINVRKKDSSVTVQPGITWKALIDTLAESGLEPLVYPSSYLTSTVGGFVAQGGYGIGSARYGHSMETLRKVDVILPTGAPQSFLSSELELTSDLQGTTGIIVEVELAVRPITEKTTVLLGSDDLTVAWDMARELARAVTSHHITVVSSDTVGWNRESSGLTDIPLGYHLVLGVFDTEVFDSSEETIRKVATDRNALFVIEEGARALFNDAANPLRLRRQGPASTPAHVVLPIREVPGYLHEARGLWDGALVGWEGTLSNDGTAGLLMTRLDPETDVGTTFRYSFTLDMTRLARSFGGRSYGLGPFLQSEVTTVLGGRRLNAAISFKRVMDPDNILNPGSIIDSHEHSPLSRMDGFLEGVATGSRLWHRLNPLTDDTGVKKGASEEVIKEMLASQRSARGLPLDDLFACIQCGYCEVGCDTCSSGWLSDTPRGKIHQVLSYMLRTADDELGGTAVQPSEAWARSLDLSGCYECRAKCPVDIDFEELWATWKTWLTREGHLPEEE